MNHSLFLMNRVGISFGGFRKERKAARKAPRQNGFALIEVLLAFLVMTICCLLLGFAAAGIWSADQIHINAEIEERWFAS